jgi:hypothetical protein
VGFLSHYWKIVLLRNAKTNAKFEHMERKKENLEVEEKGVGNDRRGSGIGK